MKTTLYIVLSLMMTFGAQAQPDAHELVVTTIGKARAVRSAAYTIANTERIHGKLLSGTQQIRYNRAPLQVQMTFVHPSPGTKVSYDALSRPGKLVYDPVGFPFMKLELDPLGSTARNANHHTIYEIGFEHIASLIVSVYDHYETVTLLPADDSLPTYTVNITSRYRGFKDYKVRPGETTRSLAQKLNISEYKIVELNEDIEDYGHLREGTLVSIPDNYAHDLTVAIDKSTLLPVKISLSDELGLLASYTISEIELGIKIEPTREKKRARSFSDDQ